MTPHDELMALAGKWATKARHSRTTTHSTALRAQHATLTACAADLRALLDSDAFRAMVRDAAIGRAYSRWYGAARGYTDVIADAAHAAIVRDAAASGAGG